MVDSFDYAGFLNRRFTYVESNHSQLYSKLLLNHSKGCGAAQRPRSTRLERCNCIFCHFRPFRLGTVHISNESVCSQNKISLCSACSVIILSDVFCLPLPVLAFNSINLQCFQFQFPLSLQINSCLCDKLQMIVIMWCEMWTWPWNKSTEDTIPPPIVTILSSISNPTIPHTTL